MLMLGSKRIIDIILAKQTLRQEPDGSPKEMWCILELELYTNSVSTPKTIYFEDCIHQTELEKEKKILSSST